MKKIFALIVITAVLIFLPVLVFGQINQTTTTTTTKFECCSCLPFNPACDCKPGIPSCYSVGGLYNFFSSINPFVLLIFGLILIVVAKLAKYVAIALVIFALIQILLLFIR